ncbi:MAG TPA: hypothetical protein VKV80_21050 [Streptosporangiaceae bacterium]|nr:hypothetical protein [Streptosporangiaceae bacterium]
MSSREDAHRLIDAVPDDRVDAVIEWLRHIAEENGTHPRRKFRTVGVFDGDPDLGARAKDIARTELSTRDSKTA